MYYGRGINKYYGPSCATESSSSEALDPEGAALRRKALRVRVLVSSVDMYVKPFLATLPFASLLLLPATAAVGGLLTSLALSLSLSCLMFAGISTLLPYALGLIASEFAGHFLVAQGLSAVALLWRYRELSGRSDVYSLQALCSIAANVAGATMSAVSLWQIMLARRGVDRALRLARASTHARDGEGQIGRRCAKRHRGDGWSRWLGLVLPSFNPAGGFGVRRFTDVPYYSCSSGEGEGEAAQGAERAERAERGKSGGRGGGQTTTEVDRGGGHHNELLLCDIYGPSSSPVSAWRTLPVVLYIHGGGFVVGSKTVGTSFAMIRRIALEGFIVVVPSYRLAPKSPWPGMLLDCRRALAWIRRKRRPFSKAAAGTGTGRRRHSPYLDGLASFLYAREVKEGEREEDREEGCDRNAQNRAKNDSKNNSTNVHASATTAASAPPVAAAGEWVGVVGESAGAHLALTVAMAWDDPLFQEPDHAGIDMRVQCVVDLFGPTQFGPTSHLRGRLSPSRQETLLAGLNHVVLQPDRPGRGGRGRWDIRGKLQLERKEEEEEQEQGGGAERTGGWGRRVAAISRGVFGHSFSLSGVVRRRNKTVAGVDAGAQASGGGAPRLYCGGTDVDDETLSPAMRSVLASFSPTYHLAALEAAARAGTGPRSLSLAALPPILAMHGHLDEIVPIGDTLSFFARLREARRLYPRPSHVNGSSSGAGSDVDDSTVEDVLLTVPGAHHGFVLLPSLRSFAVADGVADFLSAVVGVGAGGRGTGEGRRE